MEISKHSGDLAEWDINDLCSMDVQVDCCLCINSTILWTFDLGCACAYVCAHVSVCLCTWTFVCKRATEYVHLCNFACVCVRAYMYVYVCAHVGTCVCAGLSMCTWAHACVVMHVCMCCPALLTLLCVPVFSLQCDSMLISVCSVPHSTNAPWLR